MRKIVLLNYTYHLFSATEKTNTFKDMQKWENWITKFDIGQSLITRFLFYFENDFLFNNVTLAMMW